MKRSEVLPSLEGILEALLGPRESWDADEAAQIEAVLRVAQAAIKGGAKADEVHMVGYLAVTRPMLGEQIARDSPLASQRQKALDALRHVNEGRGVTAAERAQAEQLDAELMCKHPKVAPRFREIARRMSTAEREVKEGRVRYILAGPRKAKRKRTKPT